MKDENQKKDQLMIELVEQRQQKNKLATSATHRKQSAQPFGEDEELFYKIFNHSNDSILIIDPEQDRIIDVNLKACIMLKYSRQELLSTPISAIHPKEMPKLLAFTQSVYKQESGWTDELTCLTKTGETLSAEISASVIDIAGRTCIMALVRDITERKQMEEALVRLGSFPEQNPNPIIETDFAGKVTYCNPEAQEQFPDPQVIGLKHPILEDLKSIVAALQNGEQEFFTREIDLGDKIYEQKICHISGSNLIRIFNYDVTARKQMEKALRESEMRLARILDSAMDAIITIDNEQRITLFNSAAEKIFRSPASDALGQSIDRFLSEGFRSFLAGHVQACEISGETECYTWAPEGLTAIRADEEEIPIEATISYVEDAGAKFCTIILRDINERKRIEAEIRKLQLENVYLQQEIKLTHNFEEIICHSDVFKKVLQKVEQVASTDSTVLILGETGTGKELLARAVHNISARKDRPLVKVNCVALPANLIESELFGHEKGAFTGALSRKIGRFELANGGTIFLDEIGDMPIELQTKLLRVLQEGEIERLGNPQPIKINVRVIAATNRDLEKAIENGTFREDLYYRLNVFPITCPSLRDRKEDIPELVKHFIKKFNAKMGKKIETVPQKVLDTLAAYHWPGNVRELENIIERTLIISQGKQLELGDWLPRTGASSDASTLKEIERQHILQVLELAGWRVSGEKGAAKILGMPPTTLESRMRKLDIKRTR